ncbi:envelope stress response membrane protein PspB [Novosphingobium sp. Fuku2-ISO-50]|jgi:phage shock protein B|uniref:envelope stress response membrane protein PspB n=1 Tax=Novosphingobium sp. Fuku2-ISO-50 TaxID=1739114 RepID=UPI00076CEB04|nr:envelope stress response membrane protein PspB [Novosphingobium sp. Fuku2-ISO-50]KUR74159.1 phage shock protein B [Novosphingobium sp. Fuku2-ISO-50]
METGDVIGLVAVVSLFIFLPWIIMHYVTRWKTASTLTSGDEALLDELYRLARRLEDRMTTVERLVAADHPEFRPLGRSAADDEPMGELERMLAEKKGPRA